MEEGTFKSRLIAFARETYDFGQNKFEEHCGISRGTINSIPDENGGISSKTLAKIALACPELDIRWLLTGEKTKRVETPIPTPKAPKWADFVPKTDDSEVVWLRNLVESQQRTIEMLAGVKGASISQSISK